MALLFAPGLAGAREPALMAHRGYSARAPENTMAAFERAAEAGVGFELDVTLCATGEVIVLHDDSVDRTTSGEGLAHELDLDTIRGLDAGSWFHADFAGERVPTLDEVLERFGGKVPIDIEMKTRKDRERFADAVVSLVEKHGVVGNVAITSFDPLLLKEVRQRNPGILRGQITATFKDSETVRGLKRAALRGMWLNNRSKPDIIAIEHVRAKKGFVQRQQRRGRQVWVWTVNDPDRVRELIDIGVDVILTDDPELLAPVIAER